MIYNIYILIVKILHSNTTYLKKCDTDPRARLLNIQMLIDAKRFSTIYYWVASGRVSGSKISAPCFDEQQFLKPEHKVGFNDPSAAV